MKSGGFHISLQEDVLVPQKDLWQMRLQARIVADQGNVCEAASKFLSRDVLYNLRLCGAAESSLPGNSEPALLIVVQSAASLVQVDAQDGSVPNLGF